GGRGAGDEVDVDEVLAARGVPAFAQVGDGRLADAEGGKNRLQVAAGQPPRGAIAGGGPGVCGACGVHGRPTGRGAISGGPARCPASGGTGCRSTGTWQRRRG